MAKKIWALVIDGAIKKQSTDYDKIMRAAKKKGGTVKSLSQHCLDVERLMAKGVANDMIIAGAFDPEALQAAINVIVENGEHDEFAVLKQALDGTALSKAQAGWLIQTAAQIKSLDNARAAYLAYLKA